MRHAPATQVMITLQFSQPLTSIGILEASSTYDEFRADFPIFRQIGLAGPMPSRAEHFLKAELGAPPANIPRLVMESSDNSRLLIFQSDRVSYAWNHARSEDAPPYPGFDALLEEAWPQIERLIERLEKESQSEIKKFEAIQLSYVNAFRTRDAQNNYVRLAHIFEAFNQDREPQEVISYDYSWMQNLRSKTGEDGLLNAAISGPIGGPDGVQSSQFNYDGTLPCQNRALGEIREMVIDIHTELHQFYVRTVRKDFRDFY